MKILIATHKDYTFPGEEPYYPIQVGAKINKKIDNVLYDDSGENISIKNPCYCELTALYWLWKNVKDEIVGLVHYRRYFKVEKSDISINGHKIVDVNYLQCLTDTVDILLPEKKHFANEYKNVFWQYYDWHYIQDLIKIKEVVQTKYPEYLDSFDYVMSQKSMHICNMFVAKKRVMDEYCEWLFDILFSLESVIDISNYTPHQKRVYGFLSERLFNVWLHKNENVLIVKTCELVNVEALSNNVKRIRTPSEFFELIIGRIKYLYERYFRLIKNRLFLLKKHQLLKSF